MLWSGVSWVRTVRKRRRKNGLRRRKSNGIILFLEGKGDKTRWKISHWRVCMYRTAKYFYSFFSYRHTIGNDYVLWTEKPKMSSHWADGTNETLTTLQYVKYHSLKNFLCHLRLSSTQINSKQLISHLYLMLLQIFQYTRYLTGVPPKAQWDRGDWCSRFFISSLYPNMKSRIKAIFDKAL